VVSVPHVGDSRPTACRSGGNVVQHRSPIPVRLGRGAVCLKLTQTTVPPGRTQFIKPNVFFYFSNWPEFVNYENHLSVALKFTKLCNVIEWKMCNNFPFGHKFKFEIKLELKFLEAKILLNLGQIYWGFKLVWKKLINSPKFLFSLTFQIVNLHWHGCMVEFEVSIHGPLELVWKINGKRV
jgi:hypothetical protein